MSKKIKKSLSENPAEDFSFNAPFAVLSKDDLPSVPMASSGKNIPMPEKEQVRGRIFFALEKSGRSGKIVTIISGPGIEKLSNEQRTDLCATLKRKFACGGCVNDSEKIELQGDDRNRLKIFLESLGFKF
ncbi:MAG: translation initiation factor [Opitutales bacterium]|nr:translation initiation factor [Opitutales bacterium]